MTVNIDLDQMTNLVEVPVLVNGKGPFTFVLDTGATATTITTELAHELNLSTTSESRSGQARINSTAQVEYAVLDSLRIDSVNFENQEVLVMNLNKLMGRGNRHGVIGHSMLKECVLHLSYAAQSLSLGRSETAESSGKPWNSFTYVEGTHLVLLPTSVNGSSPVDFVLDTGAGSTVITPELAESLDLECTDVNGIARGIEGDTKLRLASISELHVGEASVKDLHAAVIDMSRVSSRGNVIKNGILGYNFLKHYDLWLDYPHQRYNLQDPDTR